MPTETAASKSPAASKPATAGAAKASQAVWRDRFRRPTDEQLLSDLDDQGRMLFESARSSMLEIEGVNEEMGWHGIPWRWSYAYWMTSTSDTPLAYLIPDPETPRLGLPLSGDIIAEVKPRKLSKPIREGLVYSTRVADVFWTNWDLQSKSGLKDVLDLVRLKHDRLSDN